MDIYFYAFVAQQVERTAVNRDVGGSSPPESVPEPGFCPNSQFTFSKNCFDLFCIRKSELLTDKRFCQQCFLNFYKVKLLVSIMNLKDAIMSRKSTRSFSTKKVDWRKIIRAIDYARFAPAAGNNFITSFIIVDDKEKIQVLADATQQEFVGTVDYVVIVVSDENVLTRTFDDRGFRYAAMQAGAAIQNFLLGLTEQGLSTTLVGHFYAEQIYKEFGIPEKMKIDAVFPIGYLKEINTKPKLRKDLDNILYFKKWGNKKMTSVKLPSENVV